MTPREPPFPIPPPLLWSPERELLLPASVRLIALDQPFAGLLFGNEFDEPGAPGPKSLETRMWPWPYDASWLAIYATKTPDRAAYARYYGAGWRDILARDIEAAELGAVLGVVWIGGCRPMIPEDEAAACFPCAPGRFVWVIGASHYLNAPVPLPRGPQKFASIPRDALAAGLTRAA